MKNILIALGTIVIIGGATYAIAPRSVLKEYFAVGDKPTEIEFADTIDSAIHIPDDGVELGMKEYNPKKEYTPGDTTVQSEPIYQATVVTENEEIFKLDAALPVTFRWTPLVPKPQGSVMYRLKVWQLMQGQNGTQAMRTNQPIVTKDVDNITQVTVSGIYTGPCRPPYLCEFVWDIEAVTVTEPIKTEMGTAPVAQPAAEMSTPTPTTSGTPTDGAR